MSSSENMSVLIDGENRVYVAGKKLYGDFTEVFLCDASGKKPIELEAEIIKVCAGSSWVLLIDKN